MCPYLLRMCGAFRHPTTLFLLLLHMSPHTHICVLTTTHVSSYYCMCPHTYICVLIHSADVGLPSNASPVDAAHADVSPAPPHVNPVVIYSNIYKKSNEKKQLKKT